MRFTDSAKSAGDGAGGGRPQDVMAGVVPRLAVERNRLQLLDSLYPRRVMTGLVPVIHAAPPRLILKIVRNGAAWVAGTSPAMTATLELPRQLT
jgi:hypothetical protein